MKLYHARLERVISSMNYTHWSEFAASLLCSWIVSWTQSSSIRTWLSLFAFVMQIIRPLFPTRSAFSMSKVRASCWYSVILQRVSTAATRPCRMLQHSGSARGLGGPTVASAAISSCKFWSSWVQEFKTCAPESLTMKFTSFLKGNMSYIILQYSMEDSTEQVHKDLEMGAKGMMPWVLFFTSISNSTCCLQDSAMYGQWSTTNTVLWDSEKIFIFFYFRAWSCSERTEAEGEGRRGWVGSRRTVSLLPPTEDRLPGSSPNTPASQTRERAHARARTRAHSGSRVRTELSHSPAIFPSP